MRKGETPFVYLRLLENRSFNALNEIYGSEKELMRLIKSVFLIKENYIKNKKVLIKPNWVKHNSNEADQLCLVTHPGFVLATLRIILEKAPKEIVIGDAPIQGCIWRKLISDDFLLKVSDLSKNYSIPITIKDFRRTTVEDSLSFVARNKVPLAEYVIFDLGKESALEPIYSNSPTFRVSDYDPRRLAESHKIGMHKYCITRELFDTDLVISMPKVKTHQKAGVTCALKNLVGLNGDKDFLPHHRIGGTGFGGDCYPGKNYFRRLSEFFRDMANRNIGKKAYHFFRILSVVFWKFNKNSNLHTPGAAWYGNDTVWRMVLDLNKIAIYGKEDGSISHTPQRSVFSLSDGIIGGQGNGPLKPEPLPLGLIAFSNVSSLNDAAITHLLGFSINKIPLIRESLRLMPFDNEEIILNGQKITLEELLNYKVYTTPPPGWAGHIEFE